MRRADARAPVAAADDTWREVAYLLRRGGMALEQMLRRDFLRRGYTDADVDKTQGFVEWLIALEHLDALAARGRAGMNDMQLVVIGICTRCKRAGIGRTDAGADVCYRHAKAALDDGQPVEFARRTDALRAAADLGYPVVDTPVV